MKSDIGKYDADVCNAKVGPHDRIWDEICEAQKYVDEHKVGALIHGLLSQGHS